VVAGVTARNGRAQQSAGQRQPAPAAAADDYTLIVGGMVACRKCAALLLDTKPSRDQHNGFHAALRRLWEQTGGRS
jgi:hypothetical protein